MEFPKSRFATLRFILLLKKREREMSFIFNVWEWCLQRFPNGNYSTKENVRPFGFHFNDRKIYPLIFLLTLQLASESNKKTSTGLFFPAVLPATQVHLKILTKDKMETKIRSTFRFLSARRTKAHDVICGTIPLMTLPAWMGWLLCVCVYIYMSFWEKNDLQFLQILADSSQNVAIVGVLFVQSFSGTMSNNSVAPWWREQEVGKIGVYDLLALSLCHESLGTRKIWALYKTHPRQWVYAKCGPFGPGAIA